ncbi:MAG: DUF2550 family protein [Jatrophihabitantaceae bacterium]
MHAVDVVAGCVVVLVLVLLAGVLARQRYMLRVSGAIPLAVRARGNRWLYGIARYVGNELRWYRSLGIGTSPSRVFQRSQLTVIGHRAAAAAEAGSLPAAAVVVQCRDGGVDTYLAFGDGAFTGFVSWLESSAPRS